MLGFLSPSVAKTAMARDDKPDDDVIVDFRGERSFPHEDDYHHYPSVLMNTTNTQQFPVTGFQFNHSNNQDQMTSFTGGANYGLFPHYYRLARAFTSHSFASSSLAHLVAQLIRSLIIRIFIHSLTYSLTYL